MISEQLDVSGCYTPYRREYGLPTGYWLCRADPQPLAVMAIGYGGFNRQHQTIVIDYRMLLIANTGLPPFLTQRASESQRAGSLQ